MSESTRDTRGPAAVGMAVVFCWGLAVQLAVQGAAGMRGWLGLHHGGGGLAGYLSAALILVVIGEALRRGVDWARRTAVALAALFAVFAAGDAAAFVPGHGIPGFLVFTDLVCLTFLPWIAWRLSLPRTAAWTAGTPHGPAAAAAAWVAYAAFVLDLSVTGILVSITLPSGEPLSPRVTTLVELTAVPVIAWAIGRRLGPRSAEARLPAVQPRTRGRWTAALVAWSVPWGVLVAVTQAIGIE